MTTKTFDDTVKKISSEVAELVIKKQHDYGKGNILNSVVKPDLAVLVRLNDKLSRASNLIQKELDPKNETLQDTVNDIIGYGLVLRMVIDGTFERPLKEKKNGEIIK